MNNHNNNVDFSFILASSVHDMKNSVGMLLQTLEGLSEDPAVQDSAISRQLGLLGYEASRINSELVQLLALYRMQENAMLVQVDECYVDDVLSEQVARNEMMLQSRNIALQYHCDPDLLWYLDAELVGGLVNNLLVNAARYGHHQVRLSAQLAADSLQLVVADDGAGFPQAMLDAPLSPNAGVSFGSGSTNLGLLFAQQIVRLHSTHGRCGSIVLANGGELGGGQVIVSLP